SNKDGQKEQLQRYSSRLEAQTKQQQPQVEDALSYSLNGGRPNLPGQSGAQAGSGARPGGIPGNAPNVGFARFPPATGGVGGQMPGGGPGLPRMGFQSAT